MYSFYCKKCGKKVTTKSNIPQKCCGEDMQRIYKVPYVKYVGKGWARNGRDEKEV